MTPAVTEPCLERQTMLRLHSVAEGYVRNLIIRLDMQGSAAARWRISSLRHIVTLFLLFAFTAQAYLTQTHIHDITQRELTAALGASGQHPLKNGKYPGIPDEKNCPLCRLAAHTGGLVAPLIELVLPVAFVVLPALLPPPVIVTPPPLSHNWQVRAPPR